MDISSIPHILGVYIMRSADGEIIYIGKAKDVSKRIVQHLKNFKSGREWKFANILTILKQIDYIPCESERDALILERNLIKRHQPFYNSMWKDDRSYPSVKLTLNEDFPRMLVTRKKEKDGALYFGPYPQAPALVRLIRYLQKSKIFPLRPCKWNFSIKKPLSPKKTNSCIYFHTKQCPAPCAKKISKTEYGKIAKRAKLFFDGKFEKLKKEFSKLMDSASKNMEYENAAKYRDFIQTIDNMGEKIRVSKYKQEDIALYLDKNQASRELGQILKLKKDPVHIEAFDTSSLFAKQAVGSMVCFVLGKRNKTHYRHFKIKSELPKTGSDDFLMIKEIVKRRLYGLQKTSKKYPDLLLIDGGMGQLSAAAQAAAELKIRLPIISLAKKHEEIFVPGKKTSIELDRASSALRLLMQIRDEAHRFAISYHRLLRNKKLLEREKE
jgi:excinuclease ABC subunit C